MRPSREELDYGAHVDHCCAQHGCKYGDDAIESEPEAADRQVARIAELERELATANARAEMRSRGCECGDEICAIIAEANARAEAAEGDVDELAFCEGCGGSCSKMPENNCYPPRWCHGCYQALMKELIALRAQAGAITALIPPTWYADRPLAWRFERLVEQWRTLHEVNQKLEAERERDAALLNALYGNYIVRRVYTRPTIKKHLRALRREVIEDNSDPIASRIAYAMEQAIRFVTEDGLVGWPSLVEQARGEANLLREEIQERRAKEGGAR